MIRRLLRFNRNRVLDFVKWTQSRLAGITQWLGRRPPWLWASCYVLLIPFAGALFWTLPAGSFYDSNLVREAGYKQDISAVASLLTEAIERQEYGYNYGHPNPEPSFYWLNKQWTIAVGSVYVAPGSITVNGTGDITLSIQSFARSRDYSSEGEFDDLVNLAPVSGDESSSPGGQLDLAEIPTLLETSSTSNSEQVPLNALLPPVTGSVYPSSSEILVPFNTAVALSHLSSAGTGDPKDASGLLVRMCYFSAIVITTLGFGDISPVSSVARILVALEAVLGVIIIGLFLNAVARKWTKA